jgi:transposase
VPVKDIKQEVENIRNGTITINGVVKKQKVSIRTVYRWLDRY